MDKLQAMRTFVAIVEHGSLTAAATALDRSLPAVVRSLAGLEQALGVRLLNRTTRRLALTDEGRRYEARCRQILTDVVDAESELSDRQGEPRGRVVATAPVAFGQIHVAPLVNGFLSRYEQVHVDLLLLDRVVDLVEDSIDVAVRIAPLRDSTMVATPVGEIRRVVCASPLLLARTCVPSHPRDLATQPCVQFTGLHAGSTWDFHERGRTITVTVRGPLGCNEAASAVAACAEGLGFGLFLSYQVENQIADGRLQIVLADFEPPPLPVAVTYTGARLLPARTRAFVDWMTEGLRARIT